MGRVWELLCGEEGQALTEYSLILALIAMVAVVTLSLLAEPIKELLGNVVASFTPKEAVS